MNKILDELPLWPIVIVATVFLFTPFGAPHLLAKIKMLRDGVHMLPIDWFDIFIHAGPAVVAGLRVRRALQLRGADSADPDAGPDPQD